MPGENALRVSQLEVGVHAGGGDEVGGRIIDLQDGKLRVLVDADPRVDAEVDSDLQLTIRSPEGEYAGAGCEFTETCHVRYRESLGAGTLYGLEFEDWSGVLSRVPSDLARCLNRRETSRVEAREHEVRVRFEDDGVERTIAGRLLDLSTNGISFEMESSVGGCIPEDVTQVRVGFVIPESESVHGPRELEFAGLIRNRLNSGGVVRCGLLFDTENSENYSEQREVLASYVGDFMSAVENLLL
ncbi:MAG: hypothetical protein AAF517_08245 [Planctomycetota bacterium]